MTKMISITIPDELHERLEPYKRELNMSQLFREKVEEVLSSKERIKNKIEGEINMQAILVRWMEEEETDKVTGHQEGARVALQWVNHASKKELLYLGSDDFDPYSDFDTEYYRLINDRILGEWFKQYFEADPKIGHEEGSLNAYTSAWLDGFIEAASKFYKEAIKAYVERRPRK